MQCLYMLNKQWCSFCLNVVAAKHFYQFYISVVMNKNYFRLRDRRLQNWGSATFVIYFVINILDINKAMIWSFHDWCNKAVVRYPVYGMMNIKDPLLLIEKSNPSGGKGSCYLSGHLPYNLN